VTLLAWLAETPGAGLSIDAIQQWTVTGGEIAAGSTAPALVVGAGTTRVASGGN